MCFGKISIPCLVDLVDRDREEMLLCPARVDKHYLSGTVLNSLTCGNFFSVEKKKEGVLKNTFSF